jgi:hypothetical protein
MPASPAGASARAISRCDPTLMRVGASASPTSKNRNSMSRARPRGDVRTPVREVFSLVPACRWTGKTHVDVPAGITGIGWARKPHREGPEIGPRTPAPAADELVERRVEHRTIGRFLEWLFAIPAKPDDRPNPGRGIVGIAGQIAPQDGSPLIGPLPRKCLVNPDEAVLNELRDLRLREQTRRVVVTGRHENPHIAWPTIIVRNGSGTVGWFGRSGAWRLLKRRRTC